MEPANYEMFPSWTPEQKASDEQPTTTPATWEKSEGLNSQWQRLLFPFGLGNLVFGICFLTGHWLPALRRFRPSGFTLFIGGLEVWYYAQIYWFSCSFRWQAFGVLLLIYWILGALWCTRDP